MRKDNKLAEVPDLAHRIADLETHVSHQDKTIEDLNDMITQQWKIIDKLSAHVKGLKSRVDEVEDQAHTGAAENRPPHY